MEGAAAADVIQRKYNILLAFRSGRQRCNFPRSSRIRVHPTPATSAMPPKFDPNEIKAPEVHRGAKSPPTPMV
ncbi:hypothetical protein GH733_015078 [Mirounga leonina]|nr:hypothetical protein GH733_015078 [Mirounga leonina]